MADKIVVEAEVKSNIGEVSKDAAGLASEFKIMGVSLNGVKASFAKIIPTAKAMFGSIKAGIASTGIGLLVIAIGSLVTYFTNTKAGAELLEKTLKTVGAAISVITDRVAKFGGAVVKFFKGDFKGAAEDAKASVTGVVKEIKEEVKATNLMVTASQKLRDAQRELNVETAQSVADIEKLKLVAEDITKSYAEREAAATKAFNKETELENKRIKLAEEAVRLKQQEVDMSESTAEDLDELAELEITLANVRQESAGRQISLQNFLNGLRETEKAEIEAEIEAEKARQEEEEKEAKEKAEKKAEEDEEARKKKKEADDKAIEEEKEAIQELEDFKKSLQDQAIAALGSHIDASMSAMETQYKKEIRLAEAQGKDTDAIDEKYAAKRKRIAQAQKAFKVAEALITTYQMASLAYKDGLEAGGPAGLILGPIAAGVAALAGLANVRQILAQDVGGGAGGGGGGGISAGAETPAPEMLSGAFTLGGGEAPEPARAYVVSDDITNNQNKLAIIRRRATI